MSLPIINEIDFSKMPINLPSLCIPRVFTNINEIQIRKIFEDLELGIIDRIDIVQKYSQSGEKYNRVFIHFKRWFNEQKAVRQRLLAGIDIKIIYDEPWFWKVSAYRDPLFQNFKNDKQEATIPKLPSTILPSSVSPPTNKGFPNPKINENNLMSIDRKLVPIQVTKIFKKRKEANEIATDDIKFDII